MSDGRSGMVLVSVIAGAVAFGLLASTAQAGSARATPNPRLASVSTPCGPGPRLEDD